MTFGRRRTVREVYTHGKHSEACVYAYLHLQALHIKHLCVCEKVNTESANSSHTEIRTVYADV
jgi:hypothetical protein